MKRFLAILLALVMCLTMMPTAFAMEDNIENVKWAEYKGASPNEGGIMPLTIGGTETWDKNIDFSDIFTLYGNNLTPVKTMGRTGELYIFVTITKQTSKVKLLVQARKAGTQEVIDQWTIGPTDYYEHNVLCFPVTKGEKIQLFFKVFDENGNYDDNRALRMLYGYAYK